jgi:hypothetical protein
MGPTLDDKLQGMSPAFKEFFREAMETPTHLKTLDYGVKRALHNLHELILEEPEIGHTNYWLGVPSHALTLAEELGLVETIGVEPIISRYGVLYHVHSTQKGREIHDALHEQGYDFAPPKGRTVGGLGILSSPTRSY